MSKIAKWLTVTNSLQVEQKLKDAVAIKWPFNISQTDELDLKQLKKFVLKTGVHKLLKISRKLYVLQFNINFVHLHQPLPCRRCNSQFLSPTENFMYSAWMFRENTLTFLEVNKCISESNAQYTQSITGHQWGCHSSWTDMTRPVTSHHQPSLNRSLFSHAASEMCLKIRLSAT